MGSIRLSDRYIGDPSGEGDCDDASELLGAGPGRVGSSSVGRLGGNEEACALGAGKSSASTSTRGKLFALRAAAAACSR